jgi:hypothetical protein
MNDEESKSTSDARAKKHVASRKTARAESDAVFASMDARAAEQFFAKRGFSPETIKALVAHGILMPEELLFMTADPLRHIPFASAEIALGEIWAYRERFLGEKK